MGISHRLEERRDARTIVCCAATPLALSDSSCPQTFAFSRTTICIFLVLPAQPYVSAEGTSRSSETANTTKASTLNGTTKKTSSAPFHPSLSRALKCQRPSTSTRNSGGRLEYKSRPRQSDPQQQQQHHQKSLLALLLSRPSSGATMICQVDGCFTSESGEALVTSRSSDNIWNALTELTFPPWTYLDEPP